MDKIQPLEAPVYCGRSPQGQHAGQRCECGHYRLVHRPDGYCVVCELDALVRELKRCP